MMGWTTIRVWSPEHHRVMPVSICGEPGCLRFVAGGIEGALLWTLR